MRGKRAQKAALAATVTSNFTYLLVFIFAEKGAEDTFSSMGLLTDGMGTLEIPLS